MNRYQFLVQGSSPEPYVVTFEKNENNLTAQCTCTAGTMGQYCKHRFNILNGDDEGVVSENLDEVEAVAELLPGTDVQAALA